MITEYEVSKELHDLDERYRKEREILSKMLEYVRGKNQNGPVRQSDDPTKEMFLGEGVEHFLLQIPGNFTLRDARKFIQEKSPQFASRLKNDAPVSTALARMKKTGQIKVVIPKAGPTAAIYANSGQSKNGQEPLLEFEGKIKP